MVISALNGTTITFLQKLFALCLRWNMILGCFLLVLEELWRRSEGVLEELWRRCGGGLEEVWGSSGGGLERSGGGLEELWRRSGEEGCNLGLDWPKVQYIRQICITIIKCFCCIDR